MTVGAELGQLGRAARRRRGVGAAAAGQQQVADAVRGDQVAGDQRAERAGAAGDQHRAGAEVPRPGGRRAGDPGQPRSRSAPSRIAICGSPRGDAPRASRVGAVVAVDRAGSGRGCSVCAERTRPQTAAPARSAIRVAAAERARRGRWRRRRSAGVRRASPTTSGSAASTARRRRPGRPSDRRRPAAAAARRSTTGPGAAACRGRLGTGVQRTSPSRVAYRRRARCRRRHRRVRRAAVIAATGRPWSVDGGTQPRCPAPTGGEPDAQARRAGRVHSTPVQANGSRPARRPGRPGRAACRAASSSAGCSAEPVGGRPSSGSVDLGVRSSPRRQARRRPGTRGRSRGRRRRRPSYRPRRSTARAPAAASSVGLVRRRRGRRCRAPVACGGPAGRRPGWRGW